MKAQQAGLIRPGFACSLPDSVWGLLPDDVPGGWVMEPRHVGKPHLEVVAQLGHRPYAGPGGLDCVALCDGDGGADVLDGFHIGPIEGLHELPRVGAEGLDVPALSFCMKCLEYQRRLARPTESGDYDELAQGKVEVEPLQVILADALDTCLLYTSPSPRDRTRSRMPSSA